MNANGAPPPLKELLRDVADESRLAYNWSCIEERRHHRFSFSWGLVLASSAVIAVVALGITLFALSPSTMSAVDDTLLLARPELIPVMTVPATSSEMKRVAFTDGSLLIMAPGATVEVVQSSSARFEIELLGGWVRFSVAPQKGRTWIVDAGLARIVVIGTHFTISRTPQTLTVSVHRGTVSVQEAPLYEEIARLTEGETRTLNRPFTASSPRTATPADVMVAGTEPAKDAAIQPRLPTPGSQKRRSFSKPSGPKPESPMANLAGLGSSEPVNAMLGEVDRARRRGNHRKAAALLEQILKEFPNDPAGGLVALTLGRVRLEALNQPGAAAVAFRDAARHKHLPSSLQEQAWARCVEALHRSGNDASAKKMGNTFQERFPRSAWQPWIAYWAGIEE